MRSIEEIKADIEKEKRNLEMFTAKTATLKAIELKTLELLGTISKVYDIDSDRLEELCQAEKDGRCVVLPYFKYGGVIHHLKTIQPYYDFSENGEKTFEIRKDDRGYAVGDILHLYLWTGHIMTPPTGHYKCVTYVLRDKPFVPDGYVCMGVMPITRETAEAALESQGAP